MTREDRFNYRQSRIIMELPTRALNNKYLEKKSEFICMEHCPRNQDNFCYAKTICIETI